MGEIEAPQCPTCSPTLGRWGLEDVEGLPDRITIPAHHTAAHHTAAKRPLVGGRSNSQFPFSCLLARHDPSPAAAAMAEVEGHVAVAAAGHHAVVESQRRSQCKPMDESGYN